MSCNYVAFNAACWWIAIAHFCSAADITFVTEVSQALYSHSLVLILPTIRFQQCWKTGATPMEVIVKAVLFAKQNHSWSILKLRE